jgi:hypothetical protein
MVLIAMSEISVWCICLNHTEREQRSNQKKVPLHILEEVLKWILTLRKIKLVYTLYENSVRTSPKNLLSLQI